ncbi:hypothetical protein [Nocardia abscessus]|uniref:hypothetical protein n=1 Tax=Nocardia abscessus TaxID=120957 RepID=UPI0024538323|nr:hypothetical protein [Nocardia abscessus]
MVSRIGWTVMFGLVVAGVGWWVWVVIDSGAQPKDWIAPPIALAAALISFQSWRQSRRSADAASANAELAKQNEVRARYGWSIHVHPNGSEYILRNTGTRDARDIRFSNEGEFIIASFAGRKDADDDGPSILSGESRAFIAHRSYSGGGSEIEIDWLPDGEDDRKKFTEALPPLPNNHIEEVRKKRDQERATDHANFRQDVAEIRRLLLELSVAWPKYVEDTGNFAAKLRVQALVSALPMNYAKEIGFAVDVPRGYWGPEQWPFDKFAFSDSDKVIAVDDAAVIELLWNIMDTQFEPIARSEYSAYPRPYYRIEHAVEGYLDLIKRREAGDREQRESPADKKHHEEAMRMISQAQESFERARAQKIDRTENGNTGIDGEMQNEEQ